MSQEQEWNEVLALMEKKLQDHKVDMLAMAASKGWEIWQDWAKLEVAKQFHTAIHGATAVEREEARVFGRALEKFVQVPFFLMDKLDKASADGASVHPEQTTP